MQITSVNYNRTYAIGPFLNEKIGVEATIEEGDNPIEVLKSLKELADNFNKIANPHLEEPKFFDAVGSKGFLNAVQPIDEREIEKPIGKSMPEQIMSCDSMKVLESYKLLVKNNDEWKAAYDLRFEQIKQIEKKSILDRTNVSISQSEIKELVKKFKQ
jgi:hypothetical protein